MMNALAMRPDEDLVGSMKGCKVLEAVEPRASRRGVRFFPELDERDTAEALAISVSTSNAAGISPTCGCSTRSGDGCLSYEV
jgi:hypothetical protein